MFKKPVSAWKRVLNPRETRFQSRNRVSKRKCFFTQHLLDRGAVGRRGGWPADQRVVLLRRVEADRLDTGCEKIGTFTGWSFTSMPSALVVPITCPLNAAAASTVDHELAQWSRLSD